MTLKKITASIILIFSIFSSYAQSTHNVTDIEKKYKEARNFFLKSEYEQAYPILKELTKEYPENSKTNFSYIYDDVNYFYVVCELNLQIGNAENDAKNGWTRYTDATPDTAAPVEKRKYTRRVVEQPVEQPNSEPLASDESEGN